MAPVADVAGCLLNSQSDFLAAGAPDFPGMTSNKSKEGGPPPAPGDKPRLAEVNCGSYCLPGTALGMGL